MTSSPDINPKQGAERAKEGSQERPRQRGLEDEIKDFIVGAYLTSKHSMLLSSDEIAQVAWRPTIRHVHQLTGIVYPEHNISYGTVRATIAKARKDKPAVFALGEGGTRQLRSRRQSLLPVARVSDVPSVSAKEHLQVQRAFVAEVKRELTKLQTHFQEMIHQLNEGSLVLDSATGSWEWRT